ncbi:MAG: DUF1840 domain-containing protein [Proteobacteria bacterium]|nr:DUF1840 domain-containing protein [Pseudomonadota bacterium]HQR05083.1 DUF1840 domain-containing protein [Rhodocyclaceae bacterium]
MIITFRSAAAGDVIMFGDVARRLMELMGKSPDDQGIVTVEQLPAAIATLRTAVEDDRRRWSAMAEDDRPASESVPGGGTRPFVSLTQRAAPLLELLEWAEKKKKPVTWGV